MLTPEELKIERDAFIERRRIEADAAIERVKARMADRATFSLNVRRNKPIWLPRARE